jgi:hypothetical protein
MHMNDIPFDTTDWSSIETTEHRGTSGVAGEPGYASSQNRRISI